MADATAETWIGAAGRDNNVPDEGIFSPDQPVRMLK